METQTEVLSKIEAVAKSRNESVDVLMDGPHGHFWAEQYYKAEPDVQPVETTHKQAPVVETSAFTLLQEEAKRLRKADNDLSVEQAVVKAAQLHPELAQSHQEEMRRVVG